MDISLHIREFIPLAIPCTSVGLKSFRLLLLSACFLFFICAATVAQARALHLHKAVIGASASQEPNDAVKVFVEGKQLAAQGTAESLRAAIEKFKQAGQLFRAAGNSQAEGASLTMVASIEISLGESKQALEHFNQALPLVQAAGDRSGEANVLGNISIIYDNLGEKQKALEYGERALVIFRALNDHAGEGAVLSNMGKVALDLGDPQKALEYFNQALPLRREVGDRGGEASTLSNLGSVYNTLGDRTKALDYYNQALPLLRASGDRALEAIVLSNIGDAYRTLGEMQKALGYLEQALTIKRAIGNRAGEAITLNNIGLVYSSTGEKSKALDYYNQALPLLRTAGDRSVEATVLSNIGEVYFSTGENQKALDYYNQSLPLHRAVGNKAGEAITLNNIGSVYVDLNQNQKALEFYNQSLPISRAAGDRAGEAVTLNSIGLVFDALGETQKALDYYNQALTIHQAVGNREKEANSLMNVGSILEKTGETQKALDNYNRALAIQRSVGARAAEAGTLAALGRFSNSSGEPQKALDYFNQALAIQRTIGDRRGEGATLTDIGGIYQGFGESQKALDLYNQSLQLQRDVRNRSGEAVTISNIGHFYFTLGDPKRALEYFNQALAIQRAIGARSGEGITLNNIGSAYELMEEYQKAIDFYNQALPIAHAVGDRAREAIVLANTGRLYGRLGEKRSALERDEAALQIFRSLNYRSMEADLLNNIGLIYAETDNHEKALDYYNQALTLNRGVSNRRGEALALYNIAFTERDRDHLTEALARVKDALALVESLRTGITSQELRATYFASVRQYYDLYVDILMRLHKQQPSVGYDGMALQANEQGRARTLLELLTESRADIRQGVDATLLERERSLQRQLTAEETLQTKLLSSPHSAEQGAVVKKELENLLVQSQETEAQIRAQSPRYAALTQPRPLSSKEIQQRVADADSLLLEYSLGKERSYLWSVTPTAIKSYELPPRSEIETAARQVYDLLNTRNKDVQGESQQQRQARVTSADEQFLAAASSLSRTLLAPVAAELEKKRLLIVADGALQYIPFAVLPIPVLSTSAVNLNAPNAGAPATAMYQPMVVDHEIVILPSASTIDVLRRETAGRQPAPGTLVVLADPVFEKEDQRLKNSSAKLARRESSEQTTARILTQEAPGGESHLLGRLRINRLPFTRQEAERIAALVPRAESMVALDFRANRAMATGEELGRYRFVHFATHGLLDAEHGEFSAIVLSLVNEDGEPQPGFLRAHEIYNLRLPVDLVVLSACQTGLGKEIKGEGLVGLTRGFMYAGAQRVVVSLWSVNDKATADLMETFYRSMLTEKLQPAAALRRAQLEMWKQKSWEAPYYWGAFTLQGEWR